MPTTTRKANIGLWIAQAILAALFIFGGGYKLAAAPAMLARMSPFSPLFLKFIGLCEVAGGLGLVLPGIFRIRTGLTPIAAAGLTIIMIGAVTSTVLMIGVGPAAVPFVIGILTVSVARGRWQQAQQLRTARTLPAQLQTAGGR